MYAVRLLVALTIDRHAVVQHVPEIRVRQLPLDVVRVGGPLPPTPLAPLLSTYSDLQRPRLVSRPHQHRLRLQRPLPRPGAPGDRSSSSDRPWRLRTPTRRLGLCAHRLLCSITLHPCQLPIVHAVNKHRSRRIQVPHAPDAGAHRVEEPDRRDPSVDAPDESLPVALPPARAPGLDYNRTSGGLQSGHVSITAPLVFALSVMCLHLPSPISSHVSRYDTASSSLATTRPCRNVTVRINSI